MFTPAGDLDGSARPRAGVVVTGISSGGPGVRVAGAASFWRIMSPPRPPGLGGWWTVVVLAAAVWGVPSGLGGIPQVLTGDEVGILSLVPVAHWPLQ